MQGEGSVGNIFATNVVVSNSGGVFIYVGNPGPGNPPIGWTSGAAADPYGNALPQTGTVSQIPGLDIWVALGGGNVLFNNNSGVVGEIFANAAGALTIQSPQTAGGGGDAAASIILQSKNASGFGFPVVLLTSQLRTLNGVGGVVTDQAAISSTMINSFGITTFGITANGAVIATSGTAGSPTTVTTDVFTTITTFGTGFAAGNPAPAYALEPQGINGKNTLRLSGQVLATAATAANAKMFDVPYTFPARDQSFVTATNAAGYAAGNRVVKAANGTTQVQLAPTAANGNFVLLDGIDIPLA